MDLAKVGTCEYCGQTHILPSAAESQEQADQQASLLCNCNSGERWRQSMRARVTVEAIFSDMEKEAVDLLLQIVEATRSELIESGSSLKMSKNVTAKVKISNGSVVVSRQDKLERQQSV